MNQLPTAQEFLEYRTPKGIDNVYPDYWEAMIDFAKLHVEAALKKAAKNAYYRDFSGYIRRSDENRDSILNAYPLTNVK